MKSILSKASNCSLTLALVVQLNTTFNTAPFSVTRYNAVPNLKELDAKNLCCHSFASL